MELCRFSVQLSGLAKRVFSFGHPSHINEDELADVSLYAPAGLDRDFAHQIHSFAGLEQDTNQCETGVGVYRGVAITIQELGLSVESHRWVNSPLLHSGLRFVDKDTVSNLLCLAHRLEYEKQFYLKMTDSQRQGIIKLDECPLMSMTDDTSLPLVSYAKVSGIDATPESLDRQLAEIPKCLQCQRLPLKLKLLCWCCLHGSCPPFYQKEGGEGE